MSRRQEDGLALWVFDLLYARGKDIRGQPYFDDGDPLLTGCGKRGLEGVVSKRRDSTYRSGKQTMWIKVKCQAWREANAERHKLLEGG